MGEWNTYYSNGNKEYECGYRDFERTPENLKDFSEGMKYGKERFYDSSGQMVRTVHWIDGSKNGKEIYYSPSKGTMEVVYWRNDNKIENYRNNLLGDDHLERIEKCLRKIFI